MKYFEKYNEQSFKDWLSVRLMNKVGNRIGRGNYGVVYNFGYNQVIKITSLSECIKSEKIKDLNIPNIAKIYQVGEIEIPVRFRNDNEIEIEDVYIKLENGRIGYIIMEKLDISITLQNIIDDLEDVIGDMNIDIYHGEIPVSKHVKNVTSNAETPLHSLFVLRDDKYFVNNLKLIMIRYGHDTEIVDSLLEIFRIVGKYYEWSDIHSGQFGYDKNRNIKAFDITDNMNINNMKKRFLVKENKLKKPLI